MTKANFARSILIILVFCFSNISFSQQNSISGALDKYFAALNHSGQFNGNVLVAAKDKIIYQKSFGYANLSTKKLNTDRTSFGIASITKTIVSTAILQLHELGKLDISKPYASYIPPFPYPAVTIRQLLSHTARLPSSDFYKMLDSLQKGKDTVYTNKDVIPALIRLKKPLLTSTQVVGDRANFAYTNLNYYLLALLIEKISGLSYSDYIRLKIYKPAGMLDSGFSDFYFGHDKNQSKEYRYPYLYSHKPDLIDTLSVNAKLYKTYNFKGYGDLVSTIKDLYKFDQALNSGKLLKNKTLDLAYTAIVYGTAQTSGYGLGWAIMHDSTNGKVVLHHGGGIGLEAMLVRNIDRNQTVILFDNFRNPSFNLAIDAMKILNGQRPPTPRKSLTKVYGRKIETDGIAAARKLFDQLIKDSANYSLLENEINLLGYQYLWANRDAEAEAALKIYLEYFPQSWNAWDSYGEIMLKMGKKEEAIRLYKRSLELNPQNTEGKKILEQLLKGK